MIIPKTTILNSNKFQGDDLMSVEKRKLKSPVTKVMVRSINSFFTSAYKKSDTTSPQSLANIRKRLNEDAEKKHKSSKIIFAKKNIAGVPVEITQPKNKTSENIIFYIHGGAFMIGIVSYNRRYAEMIAAESGCTVYAADYSLSPENKYPVALDECEKVYLKIREDNPNSKIAFTGDSAGGGLSVSLALRLKQKNLPMPSSLVVHSPVMDMSGKLDRSINENDDKIIRYSRFGLVKEIYAGKNDTKNYEISPVYGDYRNFPPTFITCYEKETMYADSIELDRLIENEGGLVKTIQMGGAFHAFAVMGNLASETETLMKEYIDFMKKNF